MIFWILMFLPSAFAINSFEEFKMTFGKEYNSIEEEYHRSLVFYQNLQRIVDHNMINTDFKLKMNEHGDLHSHEFYTQRVFEHRNYFNNQPIEYGNHQLPTEVNWVEKGAVTPAKNQGQCGSCWAFSTTGALEGLYFIHHNELVSFSEQQLMDCSVPEGDAGCNGGLMDYAFKYVIDAHGVCKEDDYPYTEHNGTCHKCNKVFTIDSYKDVRVNNETALQYAVAQQPVSVAIQADSFELQFYHSGVFTGHCGEPGNFQLDHGVLAVGYGTDNTTGKDYWYIKNSWGEMWGDNGFFKIERNVKNKDGKCGIAMQPSYPVLKTVMAFM